MKWRLGFWLLPLFLPAKSLAIVLFGTGDPEAHTSPPSGTLVQSGWEFETGSYGSGTVVGPSHVLTAAHLQIPAGSRIDWGGLQYRVLDVISRPNTDLALLRVAGRFPAWAEMYAGRDEVGKTVTLHGRGGPRGGPVTALSDSGSNTLRGWEWTAPDGRLRWGTNVVWDIANANPAGHWEYLAAKFSNQAGDDTATLSLGDSGGGVFLYDADQRWKFAGVLTSVESSFRRTADGPSFEAALFDRRGFFEPTATSDWIVDPDAESRPETVWFATRVSTHASWLNDQIAAPLPNNVPMLLGANSAAGPFRPYPVYAVDPEARRLTLPSRGDTAFFRLEGEPVLTVIRYDAQVLELGY